MADELGDILENARKTAITPIKTAADEGIVPPNPGGATLDEIMARKPTPIKGQEGPGVLVTAARSANDSLTFGLWDKVFNKLHGNTAASDYTAMGQRENPGAALAGNVAGNIPAASMLSARLARAVPAVAGPALAPTVVREGVVGGTMPAIDATARGEDITPGAVGVGAAAGSIGSGILSSIMKFLPSGKFRASGTELTDADKLAMTQRANAIPRIGLTPEQVADPATRTGVPLTIPELARESAPGRSARVEAQYHSSSILPSGSIARDNFNQVRDQTVADTVRALKDSVGGGPATGLPSQRAGALAIKQADDLVGNSSRPYYDAAQPVVVQPDPAMRTPAFLQARNEVRNSPVAQGEIRGNRWAENQIPTLDLVRRQMQANINRLDPSAPEVLPSIRDKNRLLEAMDYAAPTHAVGRGIEDNGKALLVDRLKAGPLGTIAAENSSPSTQQKALFGVDSPATADESINAVSRLRNVGTNQAGARNEVRDLRNVDPDAPRSLLSKRVDEANNPITFGHDVAPNENVERVIRRILPGDQSSPLLDVGRATRAINPARPDPRITENTSNPFSWLYNKAENLGSGKVTNMMQDPANIPKLGRVGPATGLLNAGAVSAGDEAKGAADDLNDILQIEVKPRKRRQQ